MTDERSQINDLSRQADSLSHKLLWNIAIPILVVIIGLVVEYKSGFFQHILHSESAPQVNYHQILLMSAVLVAAMLFAKDLVIVTALQSRYIREQFDLLSVFFLTLLSLVVILAFLSGVMPWSLPYIIVAIAKRDAVTRSLPNNADYFLLLLLHGLVIVAVNGRHKAWRGLKSVRHHQQDQRGETTNFILDGFRELKRIVSGSEPLPIYSSLHGKTFVDQLEPVTDSLVWKDQAKELIRLTSSSY